MKRTKKLLFVLIALFAISTASYAVEVSLGASSGFNNANLRGKDAKKFISALENSSGSDTPSTLGYTQKIDLMVEILPFLAIETGLGYESTGIMYGRLFSSIIININKSQVYIPLMLRGQFEYKVGVTYAAVGVKLGIPLGEDYLTGIWGVFSGSSIDTIKTSDFAMDVSFAIGQEFRLGDANYLGIRIGYDLNVIQPFDTKQFKDAGLGKYTSHFVDNLNLAITYRYAFMSKWKK